MTSPANLFMPTHVRLAQLCAAEQPVSSDAPWGCGCGVQMLREVIMGQPRCPKCGAIPAAPAAPSDLSHISRATLINELNAILDCINRQPNADIIWMLPPHQAEAVHETVQERLQTLIDLINTGLQPGASAKNNPETVSTVSHR